MPDDGLAMSGGTWKYFVDGKVDTSYTGLAQNANGWWYVKKGVIDYSYTGISKSTNGKLYYVNKGKWDTSYTGFALSTDKKWYFVRNGRFDAAYTGLAYNKSNGGWFFAREGKYDSFLPDEDNCIPITDENYFPDDIVGRFVEFIRIVYGENSLESNLQFIADAIGGKGDDARKVIRKYFLNEFFKDHCKTYSVTGSGRRPIYWLFDSGKQNGFKALVYMHRWTNGFKALVYMHRWTGDSIATVRARYVSKVQEKYENELRAIDLQMEHMSDLRQKASLEKRKEKILKQVDEIKQYDELIGHLALEHIDIDLDDGVKVNHEKVQHDRSGKKYNILAPIK